MASQRRTASPKANAQISSRFIANPQQAAAIAHTDGPAAFIAAAGTGKTAILVQRLVRLIADEGIAPEAVLCVTFTRAAADEMEKRAIKALKARGKTACEIKGLRVVTFHGLGHHMLREKLRWTPRELNQHLISGDPRQWLAEDLLRPWRSNRSRGMNWDADVATLLAAVDRAKESLIPPDDAAAFFHRELLLEAKLAARYQEFYAAYEVAKKQSKTYDLADLIYIPLSLLESSPTFRKRWQGMYQYLQVDETQDTSPSQYQLIHHLAAGHGNVVIVGDPDQAIYQFRGASPEASILSFKRMYPNGTIYRIEHNYRSTPQILDAANRLISHNDSMAGFEKVLRPTLPDGAPVVVTAYEDQESEARGIAYRIEQLVSTSQGHADAIAYRDIFVLSRTNHHLATLEMALAHRRIRYRTLGGSSFFKRKTTRDMLAYLTLVDGMRVYHDYVAARDTVQPPTWEDTFTPVFCGEQNAAFRTVAHIPTRAYVMHTGKTSHRFAPTLYAMLTAMASGRPMLQHCEEHSYTIDTKYQPGIKDFVGLIRTVWQTSKNHPVAAIRAIRELAYDTHLRHRDAGNTEDQEEDSEAPKHEEDTRLESRYEELEELQNIAGRHQSIRHFLQAMAQLKEQAEDTRKNKRDCVSLLTVHKSKGLEQRIVFVMGLVEGIFPHQRSFTLSADDAPVVSSGITEERRLAYVAFTRAQQRLFLSSITRYRGADATPSRFIHEAGLTPTDETGLLNPFLIKRDGSMRKSEPTVTAPTLFDFL